MGMQASRLYRMRYRRTLEAQSTGEDTILRKQGLSYLHYTAWRGMFKKQKMQIISVKTAVICIFLYKKCKFALSYGFLYTHTKEGDIIITLLLKLFKLL